MMMRGKRRYQVYQVDVFTSEPLGGNPLAVVPSAEGLSGAEMQAVAREMNLSESTFVLPPGDASADYRMRIFTPVRELPFAGHPSVGTAFLLAELGRFKLDGPVTTVRQEVGIGVLPLEVHSAAGKVRRVVMTQGTPELGPEWDHVAELADALRVHPDVVLTEALFPQVASTGIPSLQVPVRSVEPLASLHPDMTAVERICHKLGVSGLYCFAFTRHTPEIRARFFAPVAGVPEDPATGSAAGALGAYLAHHHGLGRRGDTLTFTVDQGREMGRPSRIEVEVRCEGDHPRTVRVAGTAVLVMKGELYL